MSNIAQIGSSRCWDCGLMINHKNGERRRHCCSLRFLSRTRWKAHRDGWHSGYRFAVENPNDPMCQADADDYGTGWAGNMRTGNVRIIL